MFEDRYRRSGHQAGISDGVRPLPLASSVATLSTPFLSTIKALYVISLCFKIEMSDPGTNLPHQDLPLVTGRDPAGQHVRRDVHFAREHPPQAM
jgi:hypothetical protein